MSLNALLKDIPRSKPSSGVVSDEPTSPPNDGAIQRVWDSLTKFIPTEVLAPYAAGLSLASTQHWDPFTIYLGFIFATFGLTILFEFAKAAADKKSWPALPPLIWRAFAAAIAFAVWALSVPTNPLQSSVGGAEVAGFLAMLVSPVIYALDTIVMRLFEVSQNKQ
ncbi:hypothetical protein [Methylomonas rivi]|uniref:Holin n=1 Tax=Methylomonas rivi TaxID=2952226 RepID=A0ABT1U9Q9_9GAMM|nr:hypothetical protein [Methylomonas sp. WSC-6]MCQ8130361.1 hypothetical protein [Methylomonas sp. WSC-6]